jgi:CRISPR-associated endonuclease Cas2
MEFGTPVQESVFECSLTKEGFHRMSGAVRAVAVDGKDVVRYYCLCRTCAAKATEVNGETHESGRTIVV